MNDTVTRKIGTLTLGDRGVLTCQVPVGRPFQVGAFRKTAQERAGKAPVVRADETRSRLGTVTSITELDDVVVFEVDADLVDELDGLEVSVRFRPIAGTADNFTEVALWELEVPRAGPSPELLRRRAWFAATTEGNPNDKFL